MSRSPLDLLPHSLRERSLPVNQNGIRETGNFVLYWLRTTMRTDDNPSLLAAAELAVALDCPLLIHQELLSDYPFASDRHHRFILEGARDLAADCERQGLRYLFHLQTDDTPPVHPLQDLVRQSAVVVTEYMPLPAQWASAARVADHAGCAMLAVDSSCLVPVPLVPAELCDRAFRFRRGTAALRARALAAAATPADLPAARPWQGQPDWQPLDLASADFGALIARCRIDHGVPPVPATPGGSQAALDRWQQFRDRDLAHYHRRRNDPLLHGTSRLSAYLHHGQISPFRLAREAAAIDGPGPEKFLDELLIWRELCWAWCHHTDNPEQFEALPAWARQTLGDHARDPRPTQFDHETLARGRTGAVLWDAAQQSLLRHGELHNNLRMTWGKALPGWRPSPQDALTTLIDLNHRFALDGSDPGSAGGLLWCLGLFDRPFTPPAGVLGSVRQRPLDQHAARLDSRRYRAEIAQPATARQQVAVIGAGVAGLMAARTLQDQGHQVRVWDKGRAPGGRCAVRTSRQDPTLYFEHGAPLLQLADVRLQPWVRAWHEQGLLVRPPEWLETDPHAWLPMPDARALANHLASELELTCATRVTAMARQGNRWQLHSADGPIAGDHSALILNLPAAQTETLLATAGDLTLPLRQALAEVQMDPCWTLLVQLPAVRCSKVRHLRPDSGPFEQVLAMHALPGRRAPGCYVLHGRPDFSREHLDAEPEALLAMLRPAAEVLLGCSLAAARLTLHRWRHGRARPAGLGQECLALPEVGLYLCGDWLSASADAGGALLSGQAAAGRLLGDPPPSQTAQAAWQQGSLL